MQLRRLGICGRGDRYALLCPRGGGRTSQRGNKAWAPESGDPSATVGHKPNSAKQASVRSGWQQYHITNIDDDGDEHGINLNLNKYLEPSLVASTTISFSLSRYARVQLRFPRSEPSLGLHLFPALRPQRWSIPLPFFHVVSDSHFALQHSTPMRHSHCTILCPISPISPPPPQGSERS